MYTPPAPGQAQEASTSGMRPSRAVGLFSGLLALLALAVALVSVEVLRRQEMEGWRGQLSNLSLALAEHTSHEITEANIVLDALVERLRAVPLRTAGDVRERMASREVHDILKMGVAGLPLADVASVVAANGDVINFTRAYPPPPINLADRDYFKAHAAAGDVHHFISTSVRNRGNGEWVFYLSRRLDDAQGKFAGLVILGISVKRLIRFHEQLGRNLGNGASITLLRRDFTVLARWPVNESAIGQRSPNGTSQQVIEGLGRSADVVYSNSPRQLAGGERVKRLAAVRALERYPLVVNVTVTEDLFLAGWRRSLVVVGGVTVLTLLILIVAATALVRVLHRREQDMLAMQALRRRAEEASQAKSNFLATMSHEIRTPMQAVYGLLELIGEEKPEQKIRSMVDIAKTSASGLLEILDDILDMAKIDANKMELDEFEVPVRTLVRGTMEALAVKVQGKNVALVDDIAQDVPFVVMGDPKRLRQIIMNLTGNALKFTDSGNVTIRVTRAGKARKGSHKLTLRFEITDTGIGMSEDVCQRLFQPFSQADNSTSRKYGGTGLGLSICRRLIDLMGGRIGVTSHIGQGSTFWFEIPTEEVDTSIVSTNLPSLDGLSVLSVEDHPQGAKEIARALMSMGAKVESCPTYQEGLELITRRPFDVAVIDQGLPDGLGLDLIREAMDIRPYMGMIMYTVRDDIGMQHTLQSLGVTYLAKPASRVGLGTAVKDAAMKTARVAIDGPTRLLIAEDTASVREVLQRQLERLGVEADFVTDGRQALEAYYTGQYGIIITDLHMPEIDGYDLVAAVRQGVRARRNNDPSACDCPDRRCADVATSGLLKPRI